MTPTSPIYTADNCRFSHPLNWSLSVFWREPCEDDHWFGSLAEAVRPDGLKLKSHRFTDKGHSQFVVASLPNVAPLIIVQRIKGRLQHLIREIRPRAFKRNFAIRSFGRVTRQVVQNYVADQLGHHLMADPLVQQRLKAYQISHPEIDLSKPRQTSHGLFWYSLHLVFVHDGRFNEVRDGLLDKVSEMIERSSQAKGYLLAEAGVLSDHVHILAGCPFEESPRDIALGFLNNLAYAHGMRRVYQHGGYLGTFGEYTFHAIAEGGSCQPG